MEIEAKYRTAPDALARVADLQEIAGYSLEKQAGPQQQLNTYFDSPDRRLSLARHGLRVRQVDGRSLVTLKGPTTGDTPGLYEREEHEFPGDNPDPRSWPEGPARELALQILGDVVPTALLEIATERQVMLAQRDGQPVVEISLDQSQVRAGDAQDSLCELEIELLPAGTMADLKSISAALSAEIEMEAESRSKLARGLALLDRDPAA